MSQPENNEEGSEVRSIDEIKELLKVIENKYFNLVWYARSKSMEKKIVKIREEIKETFPKDIEELDESIDNWQHGFNSGVLAMSRKIFEIINNYPESGDGRYWDLDT